MIKRTEKKFLKRMEGGEMGEGKEYTLSPALFLKKFDNLSTYFAQVYNFVSGSLSPFMDRDVIRVYPIKQYNIRLGCDP